MSGFLFLSGTEQGVFGMSKTIKFGGTSLSCGKNIALAAGIIKKENVNYVVVSAPGKRFKEDKKITDLLLACANSKNKTDRKNAFLAVKSRFSDIKKELGLTVDLEADFSEIENAIFSEGEGKTGYFFIVSRGEYMCAKLIANYLGWKFVGGDSILKFDRDGALDVKKSVFCTKSALKRVKNCVISGFYGSDDNGAVRLLPRGGSDVSGSIVAAATRSLYLNFTDVNGFCRCNPAIIENAESLTNLSYTEAMRVANEGASVIHPLAVGIAKEYNTEIIIKNTFNPDFRGTIISKYRAKPKKFGAIAVTGETDCVCVISGEGADCDKIIKEEILSCLSSVGIIAREECSEEGVFRVGTDDAEKAVKALYSFLFG